MGSFCQHLATSHGAGIPILRSLDIITGQTRDGRLKRVVSGMTESVKGGSTLEQAARAQSRYLPTFFVELVGAGETGGRLEEIFDNLAKYYERTLALARQVRGRLIYPAAQLLMLWLVANFIAVLGRATTERGLDADLLVRLFLESLGRQSLIGLIVLVVAILLARGGVLKWVVGAVSTFVWPLAPITRKTALARFTRSLSLLLRSGVPVTAAVRKSAATTDNPYIERSLLAGVPAIESGESMSVAFSRCRYMSDMAREMIYTGEESGKVDQLLAKIADLYEAEVEQTTNNLIKVMSILVLLAIATVIGVFVITFYAGYLDSIFKVLDS